MTPKSTKYPKTPKLWQRSIVTSPVLILKPKSALTLSATNKDIAILVVSAGVGRVGEGDGRRGAGREGTIKWNNPMLDGSQSSFGCVNYLKHMESVKTTRLQGNWWKHRCQHKSQVYLFRYVCVGVCVCQFWQPSIFVARSAIFLNACFKYSFK